MTNREQLKILKQGARAWNEWRNENLGIEIKLSGAQLIGTNLGQADLIDKADRSRTI